MGRSAWNCCGRDLHSLDEFEAVSCDHFSGPVAEVARDLVGRRLRVENGSNAATALILETEAYGGRDDPASHAAFRPGGRARHMWARPGTIYVFAAYGMYPCLNIVAETEGVPGAVLIRGALMETTDQVILGPGKLGRALGVTVDHNGELCCGPAYQVSVKRRELKIIETPRIGITRGVETLWRFIAALD